MVRRNRLAVIGAVGAVAVGLAAKRWIKSRRARHTYLGPCLLQLIDGLQEEWEKLQPKFLDEDFNDYVDILCQKLDLVSKELERMQDEPNTSSDRIAKVIDNELVEFLRLEPAVMSILDRYMPRAGQTWDNFYETNLSVDERNSYSATFCGEQGRVELVKILRDLVDNLKSVVKQSRFSDVRRGEDDQPEETLGIKVVKVWYATDRVVTVNAEYIGKMSKREGLLQYGLFQVSIPCKHEKGKLEAPKNPSEEADPLKHIIIKTIAANILKCHFYDGVKNDLKFGQAIDEVLVYIHGYKTSHVNGVKQAAQLKEDVDFKGTIILYSWSTMGTFLGYSTDEETIKKTVDSLLELLKSITIEVEPSRVHILAHSMGNRAVIGALDKLYDDFKKDGQLLRGCPLSQIIFVAADEERSHFEKLAQKVQETHTDFSPAFAASPTNTDGTSSSSSRSDINSGSGDIQRPHLSVYCSSEDKALCISRVKHSWKYRLGDTRSLFNSEAAHHEYYDVIDATGTEQGASRYYHSYHLQAPKVIEDIQVLLTQRRPASERISHVAKVSKQGKNFYAFNKEIWSNAAPGCVGLFG